MDIVSRLRKILPEGQVSTQPDQLKVASGDESTLPGVTPQAVVWAKGADEIDHFARRRLGAGRFDRSAG